MEPPARYLEITYQQIDPGIESLNQLLAGFEKPVEAFWFVWQI